MKPAFWMLIVIALLVGGCGPGASASVPTATATAQPTLAVTSTPESTATPAEIPTETPTASPTPKPTPDYPLEGYGPSGFPADVNPLTGLKIADPALLQRRPLIVKVENLPRAHRPQFGVSLADIVFEYYTEEGTTRFAAVFLGQNANIVGPIRSGRFFDDQLIRMFKAVFAFGSADYRIRERLYSADYANRLVTEAAKCPPMCRYEPNGDNLLVVNTSDLSDYIVSKNVNNDPQDLNGMFFNLQAPEGGEVAAVVYTRFSSAIYNRWDYDSDTNRYIRNVDTQNDFSKGADEAYALLTDRGSGLPIAADTLVVLLAPYSYYSRNPEIVDVDLTGSGQAYAFREGKLYRVKWQRPTKTDVLTLTFEDGRPFPYQPGQTWYEVMGTSTSLVPADNGWRFTFFIP